MSPDSFFQGKEKMMQGVRRELAVEQFLLEIEKRYRSAGVEPPFEVLPINKDPELLKEGLLFRKWPKVNLLTQ